MGTTGGAPTPTGGSTMVSTTTFDPSTATSSSTSSPPGDPSDATTSTSDPTTETTSTEGSETTASTPAGCTDLFVDEFDGVELAPGWVQTAAEVPFVLDGSELRLTIAPSAGVDFSVFYPLRNAPVDLADGFVEAKIAEGPGVLGTQGTVGLHPEDDVSYLWIFEAGSMIASREGQSSLFSQAFDVEAHRYVRLGLETQAGGEDVVWSYSADGEAWEEAARFARSGSTLARASLSAGSYTETTLEAQYSVDAVRVCGP